MAIKKGDKIKVEYTGTLDDGTVFDATQKQGKPLEFEVGAGQVIPGFDSGVIGMQQGEEKDVHIPVKEAYGDPNPQMVQSIPKAQLPKELQEVKKGMMLMMSLPNGGQLPAKVVEISDENVTLDINHPLAGKNLNFKIKILEIVSA